jgi:5-methylthioribose kinase
MSAFPPLQQRIFKDILGYATEYHARHIGFAELCAQLHDAIEDLKLADKTLLQKLLDVGTSLEIVNSLGAEMQSIKQISTDIERLKKLVQPLTSPSPREAGRGLG